MHQDLRVGVEDRSHGQDLRVGVEDRSHSVKAPNKILSNSNYLLSWFCCP